MAITWKAPSNVFDLLNTIKEQHHCPRLQTARIAVAFTDAKPFVKDRLNLGKTSKFSPFAQIWQKEVYDFCIVLPSDLWHTICNDDKRAALLDLHLTRCQVEYVPETVIEGKKKRVVKDDWGRTQYTDEIKCDEDGNPKWYVAPLDLVAFSQNGRRYGMWYEDLASLVDALKLHEGRAA